MTLTVIERDNRWFSRCQEIGCARVVIVGLSVFVSDVCVVARREEKVRTATNARLTANERRRRAAATFLCSCFASPPASARWQRHLRDAEWICVGSRQALHKRRAKIMQGEKLSPSWTHAGLVVCVVFSLLVHVKNSGKKIVLFVNNNVKEFINCGELYVFVGVFNCVSICEIKIVFGWVVYELFAKENIYFCF